MKDLVITTKRKKSEAISLLICFLVANLINLYAIIEYDDTSFIELFTSLGYVIFLSILLYLIWSIVRIIFYGGRKLFRKK